MHLRHAHGLSVSSSFIDPASRPLTRVHVIGPAGSGKSTLARWISARHGLPAHDLDWVVYDTTGERPPAEVALDIERIAAAPRWVTEGAYRSAWLEPLTQRADIVIWLDLPWPTCVWRIFRRHVAAELRRNNRHRGWKKLFRFMQYTRSIDRDSRQDTVELLRPYQAKVWRCRTPRKVALVRTRLEVVFEGGELSSGSRRG